MKEVKISVEKMQQEVDSIERNKTWNWENICHVTEERTIINKSAASEVPVAYDPLLPSHGRFAGGKNNLVTNGTDQIVHRSYRSFSPIDSMSGIERCDSLPIISTRFPSVIGALPIVSTWFPGLTRTSLETPMLIGPNWLKVIL